MASKRIDVHVHCQGHGASDTRLLSNATPKAIIATLSAAVTLIWSIYQICEASHFNMDRCGINFMLPQQDYVQITFCDLP